MDVGTIAVIAEELEGQKHALGRLGGCNTQKPTGNPTGRPRKYAISAARSERNRVEHDISVHQDRMKHDRVMARELAQEE